MPLALYPGMFDPFTLGHLDIATRALQAFDRVEVAVAARSDNPPLLPVADRANLIRQSAAKLAGLTVTVFDGLVAEYARSRQASVIVRGLRSVSDFDYECRMAHTNRQLVPELDTVFFHTAVAHALTSSSLVREILRWGGDITPFVPRPVADYFAQDCSV
ncbi:MAG: pantetheine-phosphate adenylyltransferase [Bacteroidota bacterium]|nr:pantetheine-phosphate adenylyltransferase [Bacteroidota bacterium]MDE2958205.1 pantetheine-phosphate adenylyltransferase [Bacteroidota bacterium]